MTTVPELRFGAAIEDAITTVPGLRLGDAANLLYGFRPTWNPSDSSYGPFFAPAQSPTQTIPAEIAGPGAPWGFPTITVHDGVESLIGKLYGYSVRPVAGGAGTLSVPSGPLVLDDQDHDKVLKDLSDYLGIDLTQSYSFMLVRMQRVAGTATHPHIANFGDQDRDQYLSDDARAAFAALEPGQPHDQDGLYNAKITTAQAQAYVTTFSTFGTHFVTSITAGDTIFQVFAYQAAQFEHLKAAFDQDSGGKGAVTDLDALNYQYYTSPVNQETGRPYGYVSAFGRVRSVSRDPLLDQTVTSGGWKDPQYAGTDSIFAAYTRHLQDGGAFLKQFVQVVPIAFELTPLGALIPDFYRARSWERLFNGALLQKFGQSIQVPFVALAQYDWASLFPDTAGSWLSTIATPTIDIYQDRIDLGKVQLTSAEVVDQFTAYGQVLQVSGPAPVKVPGAQVTLVGNVIDLSQATGVPVLQVSDAGFASLRLLCNEMYGALIVQATSAGHRTVVDGFIFEAAGTDTVTGRGLVALTGDVYAPPDTKTLQGLVSDIQFSLVAAETSLYARGTNVSLIQQVMIAYLEWLGKIIADDCEDADLSQIRIQALYLARVARDLGTEGVTVPYLTYETYKDYVQSIVNVAGDLSDKVRDYQGLIADRKQAELTVQTAEQLNANIKQTGQLLTSYFGVIAQGQSDMASYYGQIVSQKQKEFSQSVTNIDTLSNLVQAQQEEVNKAVAAFKQAIIDWEIEEVFKFCLQIATDIFSLGTAFLVPATEITALKSLGETAQKIQKVLNVLNALMKLEQDIEKDVRALNGISRALSQLDGKIDMPSAREWQELGLNLTASLASVPTDPGPAQAKANLVAAFSILALRGQAWLDARSKQRQLLTDIYYNQRLQQINADQAKRLGDLTSALHLSDIKPPDVSQIDLIGLTGKVQFQLKQVLAMLARTLALQDSAVQYEYLGQPTPINRFDLSSLRQVMMAQQGSIISALSMLNPPPRPVNNPIVYRVNAVPIKELTGGNVYQFFIQPSATAFFKYAMVRVDKVVANIEGIASSDGGEYLINLTYQANPFEDRDAMRQPITFNTVERHFGPYDYEIATGKAQFGDQTGTIEASITKVTPFSAWQISLPDTRTNKNLAFTNGLTVNIVLTFNITALLVDPAALLQTHALRSLAAPSARMLLAAAPGDDTSAATLDNLLDQMYTNQAVLKGWDVVHNMMEDPVNRFIKDQYDKKQGGQPMTITFGFCQAFPNPDGTGPDNGQIAAYTRFSITLDRPLLQFETNNHDFVTVFHNITQGSAQRGSKVVSDSFDPAKDCNLDDPTINWRPAQQIDVSSKPYVQGSVALSKVQGIVEGVVGSNKDSHSVVLDFSTGSFIAQNLKVQTSLADLNLQLSNYLQTHEITYVINTVQFSDLTTLRALQPTSFMLNVLTTNSKKNILQVFITTNGQQQNNLTINVNEPIPDGYETSLMVNTKIMFQDIFVDSFNRGATDFVVQYVDPGKDYLASWVKVASGTVNGPVDFGGDSEKYRISASGNNIVWDMKGMQFIRDRQQGVTLSYSETKNVKFQYRQRHSTQYGSYWGSWQDADVDVQVALSGHYPINVGGQGKNQSIQISSVPPQVSIDNSSLKPTGPCECNDNDLKLRVVKGLADGVPKAIQTQMAGIQFQAISTFALQNLLFPTDSFIAMKVAFVPGDLVVLGNFTQFVNS